MPRKKEIHLKALVDAVESGVPRREIMKRFGFKSPTQVTAYYLDGLVEAGRTKPVISRQPKPVHNIVGSCYPPQSSSRLELMPEC